MQGPRMGACMQAPRPTWAPAPAQRRRKGKGGARRGESPVPRPRKAWGWGRRGRAGRLAAYSNSSKKISRSLNKTKGWQTRVSVGRQE